MKIKKNRFQTTGMMVLDTFSTKSIYLVLLPAEADELPPAAADELEPVLLPPIFIPDILPPADEPVVFPCAKTGAAIPTIKDTAATIATIAIKFNFVMQV